MASLNEVQENALRYDESRDIFMIDNRELLLGIIENSKEVIQKHPKHLDYFRCKLSSESYIYDIYSKERIVLIGYDAPALEGTLEEVVIPEFVTEIGDRAFSIEQNNVLNQGSKGLRCKKLVIPKNVKRIGKGAFRKCSISELVFRDYGNEDSLVLCEGAFASTRITKINFPIKVEYEGSIELNKDCSNVLFGMAVSEIEYESFNACIEGKNIQVNPGFINAQYGSELISPGNDALGAWEVIFTLNQAHVDNSLSSIRNIIKMISVPYTIILENTKNIPAEAFMGCKSVKYVYVNDTDSENAEQRKIGKNAFSECGIIKLCDYSKKEVVVSGTYELPDYWEIEGKEELLEVLKENYNTIM